MIEEKCIGICPSCLTAFTDCLYLPYNLNMLKKPFSYCINYFSQRRIIKEPDESQQAGIFRENQIYGEIIVTNNYSNYHQEKKISFLTKITFFSYDRNFIISRIFVKYISTVISNLLQSFNLLLSSIFSFNLSFIFIPH